MYVPENFENYKYLVSFSDNYVVLARISHVTASWDNPTTIPVLIQYFNPSIVSINSERTFSTSQSFSEVYVDSDFYSRADCPQIIFAIFSCLFFVIFVLNGMTKIFKKGGIFFGS